jgi:hypothetical protein
MAGGVKYLIFVNILTMSQLKHVQHLTYKYYSHNFVQHMRKPEKLQYSHTMPS